MLLRRPDKPSLVLPRATLVPTSGICFERFLAPEDRAQRLGTTIDQEFLLGLKGDIDRGEKVFFESSFTCRNCHQIKQKRKDDWTRPEPGLGPSERNETSCKASSTPRSKSKQSSAVFSWLRSTARFSLVSRLVKKTIRLLWLPPTAAPEDVFDRRRR